MKLFKKIFTSFIYSVYPTKCVCCSKIIDDDKYICSKCENLIERNNLESICLHCGLDSNDCVCKYYVYRFNSLVCVFKNEGLAREAYYSYKFGKKQNYDIFFAKEMSNAVNFCFNDIKFDIICSVPSSSRFGFDHSGYIAQKMSDILKIPYYNNLLSCLKKKTKKQHKSTIKERLINTQGKFACNFNLHNTNILLVDDIKTTGSTLDECAKELLFAGADNVYCVTALGSLFNKN